MDRGLVALLSQALVAFTIEADNELESRMPHRTAADRGDPSATGPWLTSLTYFSNYLRHLVDEGVTARDLARLSGDDATAMKSRLDELRRWRYATLQRNGTDVGAALVIPTDSGRRARGTWAPIEHVVTGRWRQRFGAPVDELIALLRDAPTDLPDGFPITAWGRATRVRNIEPSATTGLYSALARTLLALARQFDADSPLSLAATLDFARVVPAEGVAIRELPLRAGISKEAIAIAIGRFERSGLGAVDREGSGTKRFGLTAEGVAQRDDALARLHRHEEEWAATSPGLAGVLSEIVGERMAEGLRPPENGWRARGPYRAQTAALVADPAAALPWFPMVSHRGGYPDGF